MDKSITTRLVSFDCNSDGLKEHQEFIESLTDNKCRIVHAYTLFKKKYSEAHLPDSLNYVVEYTVE